MKFDIDMTREEAEAFSHALSDVLCWMSGFCAARAGTDTADDLPFNRHKVRDLNIKIKSALDKGDQSK
ncbi:hypothetical protein [Sagittula salina]|uniref:Uncharacterized protein n=1 Tax=Sagittula salina TaxID=2820268 RepID=A0A940MNA6_9RHOB|nr:hypothetical protein [Sagittula salina]MBP0484646.1 hypothetical protein [Sagittula salina]